MSRRRVKVANVASGLLRVQPVDAPETKFSKEYNRHVMYNFEITSLAALSSFGAAVLLSPNPPFALLIASNSASLAFRASSPEDDLASTAENAEGDLAFTGSGL